jgi:cytochrome c
MNSNQTQLNNIQMYKITNSILAMILIFIVISCGENKNAETLDAGLNATEEVSSDPMLNKGIGPIKSVVLDAVNEELARTGSGLFVTKCSACHALEKRVVGPQLLGITQRRTPEWIMNMILNPEEMTKKDPIAMAMLAEYMAPMANQSLTESEARALLEYFRLSDSQQ